MHAGVPRPHAGTPSLLQEMFRRNITPTRRNITLYTLVITSDCILRRRNITPNQST